MTSCGFTLLEMLVSIVIIGMVLVAIMRIQAGTTRLSLSADFFDTATSLARMKMAQISRERSDSFSKEETYGEFLPPFSNYRWHCTMTPLALDESKLSGELNGTGALDKFLDSEILDRFGKIDIEIIHDLGMRLHIARWHFIETSE